MPELVSHVHLPVQSGSNRVLAKMKRQYTVSDYETIVSGLRSYRPELSLSSDFIVGFPGETDEDFEQTMKLIENIKFVIAYSFMFSPRPGTPAYKLKEIEISVKKDRLYALQSLLKIQQKNYNKSFVNKSMKILFDRKGRHKNQFIGRSIYNQSIFVDSRESLIGKILNTNIIRSTDFALEGKI